MSHTVLARIDPARPDFIRDLIRRTPLGDAPCQVRLWLPVQLDDGGWVSAVEVDGQDMPPLSALSGADPLDALFKAVAFARGLFDDAPDRFLWGEMEWEGGGLPVSLNFGQTPDQLAEAEAQALRSARRAGARRWREAKALADVDPAKATR